MGGFKMLSCLCGPPASHLHVPGDNARGVSASLNSGPRASGSSTESDSKQGLSNLATCATDTSRTNESPLTGAHLPSSHLPLPALQQLPSPELEVHPTHFKPTARPKVDDLASMPGPTSEVSHLHQPPKARLNLPGPSFDPTISLHPKPSDFSLSEYPNIHHTDVLGRLFATAPVGNSLDSASDAVMNQLLEQGASQPMDLSPSTPSSISSRHKPVTPTDLFPNLQNIYDIAILPKDFFDDLTTPLDVDVESMCAASSNGVDSHSDVIVSDYRGTVSPLQIHATSQHLGYTGAPEPDDEVERHAHLCSLCLLDTPPEPRYEDLTHLLSEIFAMPFVLVSIVDTDRQWFKSAVGLPGVTETDRTSSFCAWTLLPEVPEVLVVMDARNDPRFSQNPLVTGYPGIQFYAGAPLVSSAGHRLGSICVIDRTTRWFTQGDCRLLSNFSELVVREIESSRAAERNSYTESNAADKLRSAQSWLDGWLVVKICSKNNWKIKYSNDRTAEMLGCPKDVFVGCHFWEHFSLKQAGQDAVLSVIELSIENQEVFSFVAKTFNAEGRKLWINFTFRPGATSQLYDDVPSIAVPVDLEQHDMRSPFWFVRASITRGASNVGSIGESGHAGNFPTHSFESATGSTSSIQHLLANLPALNFEADEFMEEYTIERLTCAVPYREPFQPPSLEFHTLNGSFHRVIQSGSQSLIQTKIINQEEPQAAEHLAALQLELMDNTSNADLDKFILSTQSVSLQGAALQITKTLPCQMLGTLNNVMHSGAFKRKATASEMANGVVGIDDRRVVEVMLELALIIQPLHDRGLAHGEVTASTVIVLEEQSSRRVALPAIRDVHMGPPTMASVVDIQGDYISYFAPERFDDVPPDDENQRLASAELPADIWSLGIILLHLTSFSLPLTRHGPHALLRFARAGTLCENAMNIDEIMIPEHMKLLALQCICRKPDDRLLIADMVTELQSMLRAGESG